MREIRVSPDGEAVAVRSDSAEDAWNAWGVMNARTGGYWASTQILDDGGFQVIAASVS